MSETATIDATETKRPYSPRTRTLYDTVLTACEHLRSCEAEFTAAKEAVCDANERCDKASEARQEAERQLASYVEAVMSDVFSPTLAARLCRNLRQSSDVSF